MKLVSVSMKWSSLIEAKSYLRWEVHGKHFTWSLGADGNSCIISSRSINLQNKSKFRAMVNTLRILDQRTFPARLGNMYDDRY